MSQLSSAIDGLKATGDVAAFVAAIGTDLAKDFQVISALPGAKAFETWLDTEIVAVVTKAGFSATLANLISAALMDLL